jgi:eukaryotic-like serine/threonine-protein kinase
VYNITLMSVALEMVGPYQIQGLLGSGAMGEVYRAKDTRLGRDVALKILPAVFASDTDRVFRFEQEARAASALNHPAIITIYDVGFAEKKAYIAMEFVDGKNLHEMIRAGRLPLKKVLAIASQFADGLAKAHEAGIIHRDLKPENLMITADGFLKILDFGLAKLADGPVKHDQSDLQTRTSAGFAVGTAGYMSPEQAAAQDVDFRSDQFSFGSILYEMLTGRRAFQKRTTPETMTAVIREEPDSISNIHPVVPAPLRWIMERCMAKDPQERYVSTRDLARELQSLRDHFTEITSSSETTPSVGRFKRRGSYLLPFIAVVALFTAALLALWYGRTPQHDLTAMRTLTYSGSDSSPAISPNGQIIAFRSDRDGTPRIWLKQMEGGNEVALTKGPDDFPRFSPDGSFLLFIRKQPGSLFRIPVLGGEPRNVINDAASADWSPDGKRIAFIRWKPAEGGPDSEFLIVNQDGSDPERIAVIKNRQLNSIRWSPNGAYLVATVINQGNYGTRDAIALIDVEKKSTRWILTAFSPTAAVWVGTKNQIAYFVPETGVALFQLRGASRLFLHDVDSGKREPVFWAPSAGEIMDIAGTGRLIMHSASLRENLREIQLDNSQGNNSSVWLTRGNSANRQPFYSADGKRVLFSSNMASNLDLWELGTDSRSLKRITEDTAEDWDPSYSPDGNYITWSSNRNGHFEVWLANNDGSGSRRITKDGVDAENPQMTADKKWIVYNSYNPDLKIRGVWKIHPDGSEATQIVSGLTQWPEISPDGKYASYGFYKQSLNDRFTYERFVEIATGKTLPFEIEVSNRDRVGGRMRWMPDGKSIVFIDEDANGNWGLFRQDFSPSEDTRATRHAIAGFDADRKLDTFAISPDGSKIVLAEVEVLSSLILAEGIPGIEPPHR